MTQNFKHVIWEWLPGVVAGLIPLLVFLFVSVQADGPTNPTELGLWWKSFYDGLLEHLIVLGIVTSAVSTFTSFPRLFSLNREDNPLGQGSLVLVMLITIVLIFSVAMYVMSEARATEMHSVLTGTFATAVGLAVAAAATSYYIEVTIANLRLKGAASAANDAPTVAT